MYGPELDFEIIILNGTILLLKLFFSKNMAKILAKTNKAMDIIFTESFNKTLFYINMVK